MISKRLWPALTETVPVESKDSPFANISTNPGVDLKIHKVKLLAGRDEGIRSVLQVEHEGLVHEVTAATTWDQAWHGPELVGKTGYLWRPQFAHSDELWFEPYRKGRNYGDT